MGLKPGRSQTLIGNGYQDERAGEIKKNEEESVVDPGVERSPLAASWEHAASGGAGAHRRTQNCQMSNVKRQTPVDPGSVHPPANFGRVQPPSAVHVSDVSLWPTRDSESPQVLRIPP